jgi:hypothetical protein
MHLNVCPFLPFADGSSEGKNVCTKFKLRTECSDQTVFDRQNYLLDSERMYDDVFRKKDVKVLY